MVHVCNKVKCWCQCEYCSLCQNWCPQCWRWKIVPVTTTASTNIEDYTTFKRYLLN